MEQTNSKAEALLEQGMDYIENDAVDRGLPYLKQAAELGLLEAQAMYLGTLLLSEDSDKDYTKEIKKCVEWIRAAAINGNPEGQEMLGEIYSGGLGVPENQETAVKWYRKAAMHRDEYSLEMVNLYYTAHDGKKAKEWFKTEAKLRSDQWDQFFTTLT